MSSSSLDVPGRVLRALESDRADRKSAEHDGHRVDVVRPPKARPRARRGEPVKNNPIKARISRMQRAQLAHKAVRTTVPDADFADYDEIVLDEDGRESGAEHDS